MYSMKTRPLFVLAALSIFLAATRANAAGRERLRFDDGWKFHLADATTGTPLATGVSGVLLRNWHWKIASNPAAETPDATRADFDDSAWATLATAHEAITTGNTSAWFRMVLPVGSAQGLLHFESADDNADVYLNGHLLARHSGWDEPFDVPLGPAWKEGGPNMLTVLVENVDGRGGLDAVYLQDPAKDAPSEAASGPAMKDYDDADWRGVQLPHDFIVEGTFDPKADVMHGFLPKGAGWYRKTFNLSMQDRGKTLWLEFDGVYRDSQMWLNGHLLGRHASGYTSFYYDISQFANYADASNVLTVWADARQNEGWWYEGGGIYRHVYLTRLAPVHIAHWGTQILATPSEDFTTAQVSARVDLENSGGGSEKKPVQVESVLNDPEGRPVGKPVDTLLGLDQTGTVSQSLTVEHPRLWSPDTPTLYTLKITVRQGQEVVDQQETVVGIRSLRWDADQGFLLNGKPFKIQGTCNHQDFAGIGVALPDRVHAYKVEKLKEMGSNAFRFSHQPMAPELLDACDRLGMVVMDENRKLGATTEILGQVESLVRRDRNHPCVILWSMCNEESAQGTERGGQRFAAMKEVVLRWDQSRPITCAMNGDFGSGVSLVEDLQGFNYNPDRYDAFHTKFPRQPCYGSETASEMVTRGVYTYDGNRGFVGNHATVAEAAWKPIAERPWMAGGFVWTGFDYRGEPSPFQWPCVNSHFGIMDTCGFPKDSYYYYLSEWGGKPVAHISAQWNHAGQEGQEIPVWVTGNAARYELFLNGTSLGAKDMPVHQHLEWQVAYASGTLEARGYDADGKTVATDKLETTGAPARLELVPDRSGFTADAEDVAMVRCNVLDAQGRVVPLADDEVTFAVSGPAQVAGVGNGNPSDHDPDKASKRHAFNGHCLAVVQSNGDTTGDVTLTASANGLSAASVTLHATAAR